MRINLLVVCFVGSSLQLQQGFEVAKVNWGKLGVGGALNYSEKLKLEVHNG